MLKYLKWFFLLILIICITMTLYLYIDFYREQKNYNKEILNNSEISQIYNIHWSRIGFDVYDDNQLIVEKNNLIENKYLIFTSDYIKFCDQNSGECDNYKYSYNDDKIELFKDSFMPAGIYDIKFNETEMILSIKDDNSEFIYYYEAPKG